MHFRANANPRSRGGGSASAPGSFGLGLGTGRTVIRRSCRDNPTEPRRLGCPRRLRRHSPRARCPTPGCAQRAGRPPGGKGRPPCSGPLAAPARGSRDEGERRKSRGRVVPSAVGRLREEPKQLAPPPGICGPHLGLDGRYPPSPIGGIPNPMLTPDRQRGTEPRA